MERAILFLNLGGPETQKEVRSFLYRLFKDPEIIRIPFTPLRNFVACLISTTREKESQAMYAKIGGGSPIRRLTDRQAEATQSLLTKNGMNVLVRTAFNCSNPLIEDVVADLYQNGIRKFLAFPLYPQYSFTTTKGALDRTRQAIKKLAPDSILYEIHSWNRHPLFIRAHAELIRKFSVTFSNTNDDAIHLIFSAHSIPEKLVTTLGDPYKNQMEETVQDVLKIVNWKGPWSLSWQSKLGPVKWLEPSTEDTLIKLGKSGVKQVLVIPIAFVTDHIETLYEVDQMLSATAKSVGITEFKRVPGLNNYPIFIEALADIALQQKEFWSN